MTVKMNMTREEDNYEDIHYLKQTSLYKNFVTNDKIANITILI